MKTTVLIIFVLVYVLYAKTFEFQE